MQKPIKKFGWEHTNNPPQHHAQIKRTEIELEDSKIILYENTEKGFWTIRKLNLNPRRADVMTFKKEELKALKELVNEAEGI